ncbi:hypothetical protein AC249_AIPGENE29083 [Exaiptasia diaphana]|nr:hypothetical protein AC249_AIPGENE29083 [Exaiptasia diaphana]
MIACCGKGCEVWWKRVEEPGLEDYGTSKELIIKSKLCTAIRSSEWPSTLILTHNATEGQFPNSLAV